MSKMKKVMQEGVCKRNETEEETQKLIKETLEAKV
jgi:hypothetical protein